MSEREAVSVAFRVDKYGQNKEVTAVFSGVSDGVIGLTCYAHMGQHGSCSPVWYWNSTRPATTEESADLLAELDRIGYDVTVVKRVHWL